MLGTEPAYKQVEQPFVHIHEIAKLAVAAYHSGDVKKAEEYLEVITKNSQIDIDNLRVLQKIMVSRKT